MKKITPCLWFDTEAEEAANLYVSLFKNSKINQVTRYTKSAEEISGKSEGSVLTVDFELEGERFTALNGGPQFKFSEAISFQVSCETQEEVDHFWGKLSDGGEEGQCGWLKDKFGLSWQITPIVLMRLIGSSEKDVRERVIAAMMPMKKLDIAKLEEAAHASS